MTTSTTTTGDIRVIRDQHGCLLLRSALWGTIIVAESDIARLIADLERERSDMET